MEVNKILQADFLDILFDGRNKQYGAYELRQKYSRRLMVSLMATMAIILLIFLGSVLSNVIGGKKSGDEIDVMDTELAKVNDAPPPPPPPKAPPPPEVNQVKFTPPKIVPDEEVKPEEKIEEIKEDQAISTVTKESDNEQVVSAPVVEESSAVETPPVADDEDKVFQKVEVEAEYDGNWVNFLSSNLNAELPAENGAEAGSYTVIVRFIVSKDGSISDIVAESDPGYGLANEAIRVIKKSKKWRPGEQNGRQVTCYKRQPITWLVQ